VPAGFPHYAADYRLIVRGDVENLEGVTFASEDPAQAMARADVERFGTLSGYTT